jgi:glycosyltransferase involved in cell wall biosynthesis
MKVLMVSDMIMHGGAVHTRFLSRELIKRGIDAEIFSYTKTSEPGIKTSSTLSLPLPLLFYQICLNKKGFFKILNETKPDLVHMHHCAGSLELSIDKIKRLGIHVVGTVHTSPHGSNLVDRIVGAYFNNFLGEKLKKSDKVIGVSKYIEEKLNDIGINNTITIPNGIDPKIFFRVSNAREILGIPDDEFILLYVGRLSPEKGIKTLFRSFKRLDIPNKKLYIIGSGPMSGYCRLYSKLKRDVVFLGKVRESDLRLYYSSADLTLSPSLWNEGFGMVLIESMVCGTPPVASSLGAIPEIVKDNYNGFLVRDVSPEGFAKRILEARGSDLKKIGEHGISFVNEGFSWNNVADQTKNLYESILSQ